MKDKFVWCLEQKQGVRLIEPNENLMKDYFVKAMNALKMMRKAEQNPEWKIAAGYYAMYFSAYAILMKTGVRSELHSCTIEIIRLFFNKYFSEKEIEMLEKAKNSRIATQYYVVGEMEMNKHAKNVTRAENLYFKSKELCSKIRQEEISVIREQIKERMNNALKEKRL